MEIRGFSRSILGQRRDAVVWRTAIGLALALATCVGNPASSKPALRPGARYVAMGSSFASGPGVTTSADTPPNRCSRSIDNYAHQLARKRSLTLVDVSCGGATTANVLQPWDELPAQVDALTPDTALVTITIGGNDVGFIGGLMMGSCSGSAKVNGGAVASMCQAIAARFSGGTKPALPPQFSGPTEESWRNLETAFNRIAAEVRQRSPRARLVFVEYPVVVPARKGCATAPISVDAAARASDTAVRLARLTAAAARRAGADLIRTSALSRRHDACSTDPWVTGFIPPPGATGFAAYHPNLAGMTAIARALDHQLGR
ncbi:MAG: SGNH/GDSL hydrolase family protein [Novosphingobium sp.]